MDTAVQAFQYQLQCPRSDTRKSAGQRVRSDEHDGSNCHCIKRFTDTDRVTQYNVLLKKLNFIRADDLVFKGTEAGRDAVSDVAAVDQSIDRLCASGNARFCRVSKR